MGIVLRGWDAELNRAVAIKLLLPHLASSGPARNRFLREAQAAAAVVHPNVIPIHSVSSDGPLPYLVMPLVAGGNLQQRIERDGPLELEDALRIGLQIAEGLAAAHRQGLVHRDIKPANILLEDGGRRVLISDFGLARALDDATLTASGMIAGTPQYMSPEQAAGEIVDHQTDIYSLGGVMYAIATGRPPVKGESSARVLRDIGRVPRTPVHEVNERMPLWFDRLLCHFMHPDRAKRPESAAAAVGLLQACLAHARAPARADLPAQLASARSRNALIIGALGLATVVMFGFLATSQLEKLTPRERADGNRGNEGLVTVDEREPARSAGAGVPVSDASGDSEPTQPEADLDLELWRIEQELRWLEAEIETSTPLHDATSEIESETVNITDQETNR